MKQFIFLLVCLVSLFVSAQDISSKQWQDDLKFLQKTINEDYPFLFKKTTSKEFNDAVDKLYNKIPKLQDHEIIVEFSKLVALFKYGHTDISFRQGPHTFHWFPYNLYQYNDGIYIQGTTKENKTALGAKVLELEGLPIEKALEIIYPVVNSENEQYFKAFGINYLRIAEVLHTQRITSDLSNNVTLTLQKDGKTFKYTFNTLPEGERPPVKYSHIFTKGDWLDARDQAKTPLYLKNLDKIYFYEYLPEQRTVYVRHSQIQDDPSEDIPTFYKRLFEFIEANDVVKLVLDVRLNGGGNNYKNKPIITGIIENKKINQKGKLFVILGRRTFSACQNLVNELSNYTNAIFIGEPTSENINFYGDNRHVELPNSKVLAFLSFAWWQDKPQWENGLWLAPHLAVDMSFDQYKNNEDPVLQTALDFKGDDFIVNPMAHFTKLFETGQIEKLKIDAANMVKDPNYAFFDFEGEFNKAGYNLLGSGRTKEAVFVFTLSRDLFPESANAWDSLAEGYLKAGDKAKAKEYYNKAIALDKKGEVATHAKKMLKEIDEL